jgi:hypothetical protein
MDKRMDRRRGGAGTMRYRIGQKAIMRFFDKLLLSFIKMRSPVVLCPAFIIDDLARR